MIRHVFAGLVLLLMLGPVVAAGPQPGADEYFNQTKLRFEKAKDAAERVTLCEEFLAKFPESRYTRTLLAVAKAQYKELGRLTDYVHLVEGLQPKMTDPKLQHTVTMALAEGYADTGAGDKLTALAGKLASGKEAGYNTYYPLVEDFAKAGMWHEALTYAERTKAFTTAAAYQADYPNRSFSAKDLDSRVHGRQASVLAYTGWAKANLGRTGEALADYQAADKLTERPLMGYSPNSLDIFWGRTLLKTNQVEAAIDRLAPGALFAYDPDFTTYLKEAWKAKPGHPATYEAFLDQLRPRFAKAMPAFTLNDYQGQPFTSSSLKGKVVMLAFWFPT